MPLVETHSGRFLNVCILPQQLASNTGFLSKNLQRRVSQFKGNIFFIHGVGGSAADWKFQAKYFQSLGYVVLQPELPGHGQSPSSTSVSYYRFAEISKDMLKLFHMFHRPDGENFLVGHSYGTSFAACIAHEYGDKVRKLVLASGGAPYPLGYSIGVYNLPACFLSCCMPCIRRQFRRRAFYITKKGENQQINDALIRSSFNIESSVFRNIMLGQVWDEGDMDYYAKITCPVVLVHGVEDCLVNLAEERIMHRTLADAVLHCVEGAGHMLIVEKPIVFNEILLHFISSRSEAQQVNNSLNSIHSDSNRHYVKDQVEPTKHATITGKVNPVFNIEGEPVPDGSVLLGTQGPNEGSTAVNLHRRASIQGIVHERPTSSRFRFLRRRSTAPTKRKTLPHLFMDT